MQDVVGPAEDARVGADLDRRAVGTGVSRISSDPSPVVVRISRSPGRRADSASPSSARNSEKASGSRWPRSLRRIGCSVTSRARADRRLLGLGGGALGEQPPLRAAVDDAVRLPAPLVAAGSPQSRADQQRRRLCATEVAGEIGTLDARLRGVRVERQVARAVQPERRLPEPVHRGPRRAPVQTTPRARGSPRCGPSGRRAVRSALPPRRAGPGSPCARGPGAALPGSGARARR